jgi:hypothetical protein
LRFAREPKIAALGRNRENDPSIAFERGRLLARLGRVDEAFAALESGVDGDFSIGVAALRRNPAYRAIRVDPRFGALEQRTRQH